MADRRLLMVHAHPDDEAITTGATLARYAAEGAAVTLLTCTLGEEGDILVPELGGLGAGQADQLGGYRMGEIAAALRALGVTDHRYLGGAGGFRDSGMAGSAPNAHPRAFWRAAADPAVFDAAVAAAVEVVRAVRPQVVVTYDEHGDYGHPDHVMAHRVTVAAVRAAADPAYGDGAPWQVAKLYWTATPLSLLARGFAAAAADPAVPFATAEIGSVGFGVPDDAVSTVIDASAHYDAKRAALAAHATQILLHGSFFALSNRVARELSATEYYRLAAGEPGERDADGLERDLFAGVAGGER